MKVSIISHFFQRITRALKMRWRLICIILLLLLLGSPWVLLSWLTVETPFEPADAVIVGDLGGSLTQSIEYYHQGIVKKIIITKAIPNHFKNDPELITVNQLIHEKLWNSGVNQEDILSFKRQPLNMLDKQLMLRKLCLANGISSLIDFSNSLHTKYTQILHNHTFPNNEVKLILVSSDARGVWRKQMLGIQNTLIRLAYWRFVYYPQLQDILHEEIPSQEPL